MHGYWAEILRTAPAPKPTPKLSRPAAAARPGTRTELIELFTRHTAALVAELERRDDAEPAWFWLESAQRVGSTRRMQAHEALMHRIDAEAAAGIASAGKAAMQVQQKHWLHKVLMLFQPKHLLHKVVMQVQQKHLLQILLSYHLHKLL